MKRPISSLVWGMRAIAEVALASPFDLGRAVTGLRSSGDYHKVCILAVGFEEERGGRVVDAQPIGGHVRRAVGRGRDGKGHRLLFRVIFWVTPPPFPSFIKIPTFCPIIIPKNMIYRPSIDFGFFE